MRRSRTPPASCSLRRLWATPSRRTPWSTSPSTADADGPTWRHPTNCVRPAGDPSHQPASTTRRSSSRRPAQNTPPHQAILQRVSGAARGRLDEVALARAGRAAHADAHAEVLRARDPLQRPQRLLGGAGTISRATEDREALESDARSSSAARRRGRWRWRQSGNRRRQCRCRRCGARVRESRRFARHPRRR